MQLQKTNILLFVLVTLAVATFVELAPKHVGSIDLRSYWLANQIFSAGENPYSREIWNSSERYSQSGISGKDLDMVWNPPMVFSFTSLFFSNDFENSRQRVLVLNILLYALIGLLAAKTFELHKNDAFTALSLSMIFFPFWLLLTYGQISLIVGLGLILAFLLYKEDLWFASGMFLSLAAIKPHCVYLPAALLCLQAMRCRKLSFYVGALLGLGMLLMPALIHNPQIIDQWFARPSSPYNNRCTTLASLLRFYILTKTGQLCLWPMFVIPGLVLLGFSYWCHKSESDDLVAQLPLTVSVSLITAPYGFLFDSSIQIITIIGIIAAIASKGLSQKRNKIAIIALISTLLLAVPIYYFAQSPEGLLPILMILTTHAFFAAKILSDRT